MQFFETKKITPNTTIYLISLLSMYGRAITVMYTLYGVFHKTVMWEKHPFETQEST